MAARSKLLGGVLVLAALVCAHGQGESRSSGGGCHPYIGRRWVGGQKLKDITYKEQRSWNRCCLDCQKSEECTQWSYDETGGRYVCQLFAGGAQPQRQDGAGPGMVVSGWIDKVSSQCASDYAATAAICSNSTEADPGPDCCDVLSALGTPCLAAVVASQPAGDTGTADGNVTGLLESCAISLPGTGGNGTELPAGLINLAWRGDNTDGVVCADYNSVNRSFVSGSGPKWAATGNSMPPDADIIALGDRWCANRTGAADEWLAAMDAGGRSAQVALAALAFYSCRDGGTPALWDWLGNELINGEALNTPATALKYARAMVAAADASGINLCISLVVESPISKGVIYSTAVHVGPSPDTSQGCLPGFQQAVATCGGVAASPFSPCCASLDALGATCKATLAASTDLVVALPFRDITSGCSGQPTNSSDRVPAGDIYLAVSSGSVGNCSEYSAASGDFVPTPNSTWGPSANYPPSQAKIDAFAARMCSLADQAAPLLVDALAAGGEEAGVAAYCLTSRVCANSSDAHAAYGALLDSPEVHDPAQVLGLVRAFVQGCDQTGAGACVTVLVLDSSSGDVLFQQQVHTGAQILPQPSPPPILQR
ncbi:hypothetical protein ABPG77_005136 [Micractinium sp. CCAP 211/92]